MPQADADVFCSRKLLIFVHSFLIGHIFVEYFLYKAHSSIYLSQFKGTDLKHYCIIKSSIRGQVAGYVQS